MPGGNKRLRGVCSKEDRLHAKGARARKDEMRMIVLVLVLVLVKSMVCLLHPPQVEATGKGKGEGTDRMADTSRRPDVVPQAPYGGYP